MKIIIFLMYFNAFATSTCELAQKKIDSFLDEYLNISAEISQEYSKCTTIKNYKYDKTKKFSSRILTTKDKIRIIFPDIFQNNARCKMIKHAPFLMLTELTNSLSLLEKEFKNTCLAKGEQF